MLSNTADQEWTERDYAYMAEALRLAERGIYSTDPNPRVGCVLVAAGEIVGKGWHVRAGQAHAEVNALAQAGSLSHGATAYVTLEPCSHQGRTGPCAQALVQAGVAEVVVAMQDPNPLVSGKGVERLVDAGIRVRTGLMSAQAKALNPGFVKRMSTGRPYVRIKMAMSLDGRTAMASGESQWITGPEARADVQRLRARSSVVLTGSGTVLSDNPEMTVRDQSLQSEDGVLRQPMRAVVDWGGKLSGDEKFFSNTAKLLRFCSTDDAKMPSWVESVELRSAGCEQPLLDEVLAVLAEQECNEVLVEAGAVLTGAFVAQRCWDECVVYIAPKLMGSLARPLFDLGLDSMNEAHGLKLTDMRMVGDDIRLTYVPPFGNL